MKLVTFSHDGTTGAGLLADGDIAICKSGPGAERAVLDVIESDPGLNRWKQLAEGGAERVALSDVELLAPIPVPRRDI